MLVKEAHNIVYLSGYFHTTTERPEALWIPKSGEPTLFVPGLRSRSRGRLVGQGRRVLL
jgi:Xaa-Pro aminopeptidase